MACQRAIISICCGCCCGRCCAPIGFGGGLTEFPLAVRLIPVTARIGAITIVFWPRVVYTWLIDAMSGSCRILTVTT